MLKIGQNGLKKGIFGAFLGVFWCFLGLVARCPLYFLITREKNKKVFFLYSNLKSGWESGQIDQNWDFCKFLMVFEDFYSSARFLRIFVSFVYQRDFCLRQCWTVIFLCKLKIRVKNMGFYERESITLYFLFYFWR